MANVPYRCQQRSRFHGFAAARMMGVILLSLSCLGCWQEVRYEPGEETAETPPKVAVVESELPALPAPETAPEALFDDSGTEAMETVERVALDPSAEANSPGARETARGTALAAWRMGSDWSMAAALQAKGREAGSYGEQLERAKVGARLLGVMLPDLPVYEADSDRLAGNLIFLLEKAGPQLASKLRDLHGADHAALVELATKTHVLLLSYTPSSTLLEPVIVAIRQAAKSSGLPESVWRELVDLLTARAEFKQVKAAIFQLHLRAAESLGNDD
ncbi:MAG: hypothetical protein GXP24_06825 [Planctomycetes bacterium]|nr:hypothetical protein [Planctomycetota bacterium]